MSSEEFRVELVAHATLRLRSGGKTLLTDPWLLDPIGCNSGFHYPPLVHDPGELAATTDAIYVSHPHPDHFHPPSLDLFPRSTPVYIGEYRLKEFRDEVRALGFPVIEVPFARTVDVEGTPFEIAILEHDYDESAAWDSSLVVRTPEFSLFENNDCFLRPEKYAWVRERFALDYAFLGYSPASFFPICFEMDAEEKSRLLVEAAERRYGDFLDAAAILQATLTVPFASGARFLHADALWKNVAFNSAVEAVRRLSPLGLAGESMGPGDRILDDGSFRRSSPVLEAAEELAAIERHAREVQEWVCGFSTADPPIRPGLVERFRDYILERRRITSGKLPDLAGSVIAYELVGPEPHRFYFDFSRKEGEIFAWGEPARYDMRYTYPALGLQARLDDEIDWDELHFTNDVSVHQVRYARDFYRLLRSEVLDLG